MSEIKLKPCPFCGDEKDLQILNTGDLVGWTCHYDCDKQMDTVSKLNNQWFANCPTCGACGPMYYVGGEFGEADCEICKAKAIEGWNRRADNKPIRQSCKSCKHYTPDPSYRNGDMGNCLYFDKIWEKPFYVNEARAECEHYQAAERRADNG